MYNLLYHKLISIVKNDDVYVCDIVDFLFWAIPSRKWTTYLWNFYIQRYNICIPLERLTSG